MKFCRTLPVGSAQSEVLLEAAAFEVAEEVAQEIAAPELSPLMPATASDFSEHVAEGAEPFEHEYSEQAFQQEDDVPVAEEPQPAEVPAAEPEDVAEFEESHSHDQYHAEHAAPLPFVEPVFTHEDDAALDPAVLLLIKDELDPDLLPVFLEEGRDMLPQMGQDLRSWQGNPSDTAAAQSVLRILHTVKGSARMAGAMSLGQHMHEMETRIEQMTHSGVPSAAALEEIIGRYDHGLQLFEELQNPHAATSGRRATDKVPRQAAAPAEIEVQRRSAG